MRDRKTYLGSTDFAAIVGVCPYRTPLDVYNAKINGETIEENERMKWGTLLEPVIVREFMNMMNISFYDTQIFANHPKYAFIGGTADALSEDYVIEVKTTHAFNKGFSETIPHHYFVQCQILMGLHGRQLCHVPVLMGGQSLKKYTEDFDPALFHMLISRGVAFWNEHILTKIPPPQTDLEVRTFEREKSLNVTDEKLALIKKYHEHKNESTVLTAKAKLIKDTLFTGTDAQFLVSDGKVLARKMEITSTGWDEDYLINKLTPTEWQLGRKEKKYYQIRVG